MYRDFAHPVLRPFLRVALGRLSKAIERLPRPLDAPYAHAPGTDPDRVLVFGNGAVMGYGVLSHDLALPGQLARQISAATGRGVDVDVDVDTDTVVQSSLERLRAIELWHYDSIVLSIGANNSLLLTGNRTWRTELTRIVEYLVETTASSTGIYLLAIPPLSSIGVHAGGMGRLSERRANRMNLETRRIASRFANVTFIPFSPLVKADFTRYRSAATYQQWASVIAAPLITDLARAAGSDVEPPVLGPLDEIARQGALDAIGILDSDAEERFNRIANLSTQLFGADQTLIMFIDRDRLWIKAASTASFVTGNDLPRTGSFADWAIREPAPFVVEDTTKDPRFAQHDSVLDEQIHLRFYASHPIEWGFGERVGMISVLARQPRSWSENESKLLRDLALMVQRELAAG